jgi:hypothetical protein
MNKYQICRQAVRRIACSTNLGAVLQQFIVHIPSNGCLLIKLASCFQIQWMILKWDLVSIT